MFIVLPFVYSVLYYVKRDVIYYNQISAEKYSPTQVHPHFSFWHWSQIRHSALFFHSPDTQSVGSDLGQTLVKASLNEK